jgi:hypothetical protein
MRQHCRTQHGYDPEPNRGKSLADQFRNSSVLGSPVDATRSLSGSEAIQAILKMIDNSLRFQHIGVVDDTGGEFGKFGVHRKL